MTNAEEPEEIVAPGNAFAVARGTRAPTTLRFLRRNGKRFALPYGNMPIIWGESPALVLIEYPNIGTAILSGIDLEILETRLCEYRVTWIRECTEDHAATLPVAVTRIEWMQRYPSREENISGGDADLIDLPR